MPTEQPGATFFADDKWLATMPAHRRDALSGALRLRSVESGARIYRIGDRADGFYALLSGLVRLVSYPCVGSELVAGVMSEGWFGQVSIIDGEPRRHDAIACGPVALGMVTLRDWKTLASEDPQFLGDMARLGCIHMRRQMDEIDALMTYGAKGRLGRLLRQLASPFYPNGPQRVALAQESLANLTGISRQRVNFLLREMEADGAIRTGYNYVEVLDPEAVSHDGVA